MQDYPWKEIENENLEIRTQVALKDYCTYKVGGPAEYFCEPADVASLQSVLRFCKTHGIGVTVIGKGSNLLISDEGIAGMVIVLSDSFANYGFLPREMEDGQYEDALELLSPEITETEEEEQTIWFFCQAGADMREASRYACSHGTTGLEFATGIPGSVGGALFMNAGAYEGMTADVAQRTFYLDENYNLRSVSGNEHAFGYRKSIFQEKDYIVIATLYELKKDLQEVITQTVDLLTAKRENSQPLEWPSCGSVFKRPEGYFAGKLISDAGLQGYNVNGAEVSKKHAGFIVNLGGAMAKDILSVIRHVQKTIKEKDGVELETEVRFMGDWKE